MNTHFTLFDHAFYLTRYPEHLQHPSWQAWDAADELIIEHIHTNVALRNEASICIFNDDFGALSCWFKEYRVHHVSDSLVAQKSCQINHKKNLLHEAKITYLTSLDQLPTNPDVIIIKLPKTLALLEYQLASIANIVSSKTVIVAGAKANAIQKSTLSLFEKYIGETRTSLAKKKARLIFATPDGRPVALSIPKPSTWKTDDGLFTISNHANVFSRGQLDIGARFLLQHIPDCNRKTVIDLGCGNGVLGLYVLHNYPDSKVLFVDESYMAVESARHNVRVSLPGRLKDCEFVVSNCLEDLANDIKADLVLCNPPFHQQNTITDHIATQMFTDARQHLKKGGELRIIGNRHLDYPQKLKRLFGGYHVISSDKKFSILGAIKR